MVLLKLSVNQNSATSGITTATTIATSTIRYTSIGGDLGFLCLATSLAMQDGIKHRTMT